MILVTGAGGTVGTEVVKRLREQGVPFRAAYHSPEKAAAAREKGIDTAVLDFAKPETIAPALGGIDRLFLLYGGGMEQTGLEINVVEEARKAGVKHIVKLSVWGAEDEDFSFARKHRPVEKKIEASGLNWTFLRPNGFMQNLANYAGDTIRNQGVFYEAAADAKISHVDVRDIAKVAVAALTDPDRHAGKAYDLSGPEALTYAEIAEKISSVAGKPVKYVAISDDDLRGAMAGMGIPADYAEALVDLNRYYREGRASRIADGVEKGSGTRPANFDQYVQDYAEAFRG
jgi:uncharacterized protein YbjT (DUF2867 family)